MANNPLPQTDADPNLLDHQFTDVNFPDIIFSKLSLRVGDITRGQRIVQRPRNQETWVLVCRLSADSRYQYFYRGPNFDPVYISSAIQRMLHEAQIPYVNVSILNKSGDAKIVLPFFSAWAYFALYKANSKFFLPSPIPDQDPYSFSITNLGKSHSLLRFSVTGVQDNFTERNLTQALMLLDPKLTSDDILIGAIPDAAGYWHGDLKVAIATETSLSEFFKGSLFNLNDNTFTTAFGQVKSFTPRHLSHSATPPPPNDDAVRSGDGGQGVGTNFQVVGRRGVVSKPLAPRQATPHPTSTNPPQTYSTATLRRAGWSGGGRGSNRGVGNANDTTVTVVTTNTDGFPNTVAPMTTTTRTGSQGGGEMARNTRSAGSSTVVVPNARGATSTTDMIIRTQDGMDRPLPIRSRNWASCTDNEEDDGTPDQGDLQAAPAAAASIGPSKRDRFTLPNNDTAPPPPRPRRSKWHCLNQAFGCVKTFTTEGHMRQHMANNNGSGCRGTEGAKAAARAAEVERECLADEPTDMTDGSGHGILLHKHIPSDAPQHQLNFFDHAALHNHLAGCLDCEVSFPTVDELHQHVTTTSNHWPTITPAGVDDGFTPPHQACTTCHVFGFLDMTSLEAHLANEHKATNKRPRREEVGEFHTQEGGGSSRSNSDGDGDDEDELEDGELRGGDEDMVLREEVNTTTSVTTPMEIYSSRVVGGISSTNAVLLHPQSQTLGGLGSSTATTSSPSVGHAK